MNDHELNQLLLEHETWLNTGGQYGKRLNLSCRDLSGLRFYDANLEKSVFYKCDFESADFSRAKLRHASLKDCCMKYTNFSHVKFDYASLRDSNLFCTNFYGASLRLADISGTNLKGAHLFSTRLPANTWLILGEEYSMQITHGVTLRAGCQNHSIEDWRSFREKDIEAMDGERALNFYPRLLDILDFHLGKGERPDWL